MKTAPPIALTDDERTALQVWLRLRTPARLALRAEIVLLAAEGATNQEIADRLGVSRKTASLWRRRFQQGGLAGIEKEAPRGRPAARVDAALIRQILRKSKERPPHAPHWTIRSLAGALGISPSLVQRVWKANGVRSRNRS